MTDFIGRYAYFSSNSEGLPDIDQKMDNEFMKALLKTTILFSLLLGMSCNAQKSADSVTDSPESESEQLTDLESKGENETVNGVKKEKKNLAFDIEGNKATCEPISGDKVCTEIFSIEDRFASKCRDEGHKVIQCDCHKFLCQTKDGRPLEFDPM